MSSKIFNKILSKYNDINIIFGDQLYHIHDNSKKVFLDEMLDNTAFEFSNSDPIAYFIALEPLLYSLLEEEFQDEKLYVCLRTQLSCYTNSKHSNSSILKDLKTLSYFGLKLPSNKYIYENHDEIDLECYYYVFYKEKKENLRKYIWAQFNHFTPYDCKEFPFQVYFLSGNLDKIIHCYDDRGFDVIYLK